MTKFYRNNTGKIVEFNEALNLWVDIEHPSSVFKNAGGKPYGFDVGDEGTPVSKMEIAVACRNASGMADMIVVPVFVSEREHDLGLHYDHAEAIAEERGYEEPMLSFDKAEHSALIAAASQVVPPSEDTYRSICAALVKRYDAVVPLETHIAELVMRARAALLQPCLLDSLSTPILLAALRLLQQACEKRQDLTSIAEIIDPAEINLDAIDVLCEQINIPEARSHESYEAVEFDSSANSIE